MTIHSKKKTKTISLIITKPCYCNQISGLLFLCVAPTAEQGTHADICRRTLVRNPSELRVESGTISASCVFIKENKAG